MIYYVDPVNGNDSNDGLSWGTAYKTLLNGPTFARLGQTDSDEIRIAKSPDPISIGDVTWTHGSNLSEITIPALSNLVVDNCDSGWTAGLVTPSYTTAHNRQGTSSVQVVMSSTNGKVCHKTLAALDLTGYTRITFWVNLSTNQNHTAGSPLQIRLCSDTDGLTAVNTFTFPSYFYPANYWVPITIDAGSSLGSSIQSVAIYTTSSFTATMRVDNITVAKPANDATSLVLTDLIAKNNGNGEYFPIGYITGTVVSLNANFSSSTTMTAGAATTAPFTRYYSINGTETVDTVKRECFSTAIAVPATAVSSAIGAINYTNSNVVGTKTYQGGYNTSTNTVDGETWFDGVTSYGYGITQTNAFTGSWTVDKISAVRYYIGLITNVGDDAYYTNVNLVNNYQSYNVRTEDTYVTRQFRTQRFTINIPWLYVGLSAIAPSVSHTNNAHRAYIDVPAYRPSMTVGNVYNRNTTQVLVSDTPFNFTITGTAVSNVSNNGGMFGLPQRGVISVNNVLLIPHTSALFQTYYIFNATAPLGVSNYGCDGVPIRIGRVAGECRPVTTGIMNSSTFGMLAAAGGFNNILIEGTTSNASFNCDALLTWGGMSYANAGTSTFKNIKTTAPFLTGISIGVASAGGQVSFVNYNQDTTQNRIFTFTQGATLGSPVANYWESQTDVTYSGTSAWRKYWGSNPSYGAGIPDHIIVGTVAVKAGTPVTISIRSRRTTTNVYGYLMIEGGYAGIADTGSMQQTTGSINEWEVLAVSFTPTEPAVVPIYMGASFTTSPNGHSVYFDDLQVTQV